MTNAQRVLNVLADGYYTTQYIVRATQLTESEVDAAIKELLASASVLVLHGKEQRVVASRR